MFPTIYCWMCTYPFLFLLVVEPPLWKRWFRQLGWWLFLIYWKIKVYNVPNHQSRFFLLVANKILNQTERPTVLDCSAEDLNARSPIRPQWKEVDVTEDFTGHIGDFSHQKREGYWVFMCVYCFFPFEVGGNDFII